MYQAAVLGGTGYTGVELLRLLSAHPQVEPVFVSSESSAGKMIADIHPQFAGQVDIKLEKMVPAGIPAAADIVFCALQHGSSAPVVAELLERQFRVIDLSADFRLKKPEQYAQWYGLDHAYKSLLQSAVYGLPELYAEKIKDARLVANPGCYPTSIILALAPLFDKQLVALNNIIIDSKSGVSGAGRVPKQPFHFPDCTENFKAYRVASHQHTPEIEQELGFMAGENLVVTFTPHLVPMIRGILSTVYLDLKETGDQNELTVIYKNYFRDSTFIRVMDSQVLPETRFVRGSNFCDIAVRIDKRTNKVIVISAIDNLVKGASGQAVQNMNIMLGLPEDTGLGQLAW